jgi:hypothetical protein
MTDGTRAPNGRPAGWLQPSFTRTNGTYRNGHGGDHRDALSEVVRSAGPQKAAVAEVSPKTLSAARQTGLNRLALSAIFAFSLVLFAEGFVVGNDVLRLVALTIALIFGVGTAPLQLSEQASLSLRLGVGVLVGLSIPLVVGSVMALVPLWYPVLAAVLIGAAAIWVHAVACRRVLSGPHWVEIVRSVRFRPENFLNASVACTLIGTIVWVVGMVETGHVVPGLFGFLPKAPVYWYLGLGLVVAGIVLARDVREFPAAFGCISLLAALTLTPSVVYGWPREPSGVKHADLVQNILQAHYLNRGAGIYQAYSGFFSGVAWLCDIARMPNIIGIATYWPFIIGLLGIVVLRCLIGQVTSSVYRAWLAVTMVILADTVGQDYFSPQSVGFVLGTGVFWIMLDRGGFPGLSKRGQVYLVALVSCALAVTHELTPYIVGGVLLILVIFKIIRPKYIPIVVLVPAILWALLNRNDLGGFLSLQDLGNLGNFSPPSAGTTVQPMPRLPEVAESSEALVFGFLIVIVFACVGLARNIRNRAAWAFMVSTGSAVVLVAAEPYGNEGVFRAALFSLPWLAAVGTQMLPGRRSWWTSAIYGIAAVCLVGSYLISEFGLDNFNVVQPGDYQAMQIYQAQASPDSYLFTLNDAEGALPASVTKPRDPAHWVAWETLLPVAQQKNAHPTVQDADAIAQEFYQFAQASDGKTSELYAVWSPAAANYAVDYGLEPLAEADAWRNAIIASPDWNLVYSSDGSYLFRVASDVRAPKKPPKKP